jgi:hypothetical protein
VRNLEPRYHLAKAVSILHSRAVGQHDDEIHIRGFRIGTARGTAEENHADRRTHAARAQLRDCIEVMLDAARRVAIFRLPIA